MQIVVYNDTMRDQYCREESDEHRDERWANTREIG